MFKKLRTAASNFFKKITSVFKPKVKIPKQPVDIPIPAKPMKPSTLPGVGTNWVPPAPIPLDEISEAVNNGNWLYETNKIDYCNAVDNWFALFGNEQNTIEHFPQKTFDSSAYEWFKQSLKVTMGDISAFKAMIMETDAIDYLDWYDNGGGRELIEDIAESMTPSDPLVVYEYVESISDRILSLLGR